MTELEDALAILQAKNAKLTTENEVLRQSSSEVVHENERLRQRLEMLTSEGASGNPCHVRCEPAVFDTPLPWERTWTAFQLAACCVAFLAILRYVCVSYPHGFPTRGISQAGNLRFLGEYGPGLADLNCWNFDFLADLAEGIPIVFWPG